MGGPTGKAPLQTALGGGSGSGSGGGGLSALTSSVVGARSSGGLVGAMGSPFGVVGVEPSISGRYKGEFVSMTALAAACSSLGDIAYLVGIATREPILLARRVDVGANGIAWQGMVEAMQSSDGAEFDGIFAWDPIGAAADPTWGVPGVESTGGVNPAAGALRLGGFAPFKGLRRSVFAEWYLETLPGTPATADSLLSGLLPAAAVSGDYYAGGAGYNSGTIRSVVSVNGNPSAPGLAYSGTAGALAIGDKIQTHFDGFKTGATADTSSYTGGVSQNNNSPGTPPTGNAGSLDTSNDTFNFCVSKVNNWTARLIRFCVLPIYG